MNEITMIDGTASGFTDTNLTGQTIYFIRTTTGGTDGYIRVNRKNYCKCESKAKLLRRDGSQNLTTQEIEQVYENIGWEDETVNITISGLPSGQTAIDVQVKYDDETHNLSGATAYTIKTPFYWEYTVECMTDISGYTKPSKVVRTADRQSTYNLVMTYELNEE